MFEFLMQNIESLTFSDITR